MAEIISTYHRRFLQNSIEKRRMKGEPLKKSYVPS